jgi:hypothetical protein
MSKKTKLKKKNGEFWYGQCAIEYGEHDKNPNWDEIHGDRIKVRIPGYNPISGADQPDEDLQWAYVIRPTSQGFASLGSTGLWGGEWVTGIWIDNVPYITGWLGNNVPGQRSDIKEPEDGGSQFKRVSRYNGKNGPVPTQIMSTDTNNAPTAALTPEEREEVKGGSPANISSESYMIKTDEIMNSNNSVETKKQRLNAINQIYINKGILPKGSNINAQYDFNDMIETSNGKTKPSPKIKIVDNTILNYN